MTRGRPVFVARLGEGVVGIVRRVVRLPLALLEHLPPVPRLQSAVVEVQ